MLRSVYLKSLREYRIPILGWGVGTGLLLCLVLAAFPSLVETAAARASLDTLAAQFSWLAAPVSVDTPGGYAMFKYGPLVLLIALWPLLACTRMLRGEEECGSLDVVLAAPQPRLRIALEKLAAIWTALLLMALIIGFLCYAGGRRVEAGFTFADAILFGLDVALFSGVMGGIALLLSQFTRERRTASGGAGALLLVFVVVDMVHRVIPGTLWISQLSPVYYFYESKPLVPSYGTSAEGMLVLLALAAVFSGAGIALFVSRDIGGVVGLLRWRAPAVPRIPPERDLSLRSVYSRALATIGMPTLWWTLGIAGWATWMTAIAVRVRSTLETLMQGSPFLRGFIAGVGGSASADDAILSALFSFLPLLLMAFAVTQAARWASDEEEGRLDLLLSTPQARAALLLGRYAAVATSTLLIGLITLTAALVTGSIEGLSLDPGHVAASTLGMIPLGLLVAALGYLLAGWLSTAIETGLLSFLVTAWFFISYIGPELGLPEATLRMSPFYYYGTPLLNGIAWADTIGLVAAGAAALVLATLRFRHQDI